MLKYDNGQTKRYYYSRETNYGQKEVQLACYGKSLNGSGFVVLYLKNCYVKDGDEAK